ncbi:MAG: hypothetical protein A2126_01885 [Candidatus Woykebacteria bacterium GWB1_45_5]|uniref:PIN domain-containing protein n=2 Tax=Candidatus Woykeibacteriota TaxID=1817899 RepID=A0A1G1W251_9BACT|nr:MAG: hypothetical protein A2113_03855 [Candidatus Woykebacteria bacterium GWA1_44_8]OGY23047.1 MAG: hypothetical protein A2126_01885 [Candidatus Woykebacteria bacterium GWB1_45_5]
MGGDPRAFELFSSLPQTDSYISEITAFEILIGARSRRQAESVDRLLAVFKRLPVTPDITQTAASLSLKYPQIFDRKIAHTLFDSFIAATGIVKDLEIITLNIRYFTVLKEPALKIRILDEKAKKWV